MGKGEKSGIFCAQPSSKVMAALVEVMVRLAGPEGRTRPTQWPADATVCVVRACCMPSFCIRT